MNKKFFVLIVFCLLALVASWALNRLEAQQQISLPAEASGMQQETAQPQVDAEKIKVISAATEAIKAQGISIEDATIIYDEGNKLWEEKIGVAVMEDTSPNHGVLKRGFLKNYKAVLFDFKEPLTDVWVFIDKDTGEVLEVYRE